MINPQEGYSCFELALVKGEVKQKQLPIQKVKAGDILTFKQCCHGDIKMIQYVVEANQKTNNPYLKTFSHGYTNYRSNENFQLRAELGLNCYGILVNGILHQILFSET